MKMVKYIKGNEEFNDADLKNMNSMLENVETKSIDELIKLYDDTRNGKVKIRDTRIKEGVCIYLADIIVSRMKKRKKKGFPFRMILSILCICTALFMLFCMLSVYKKEESENVNKKIQDIHSNAVSNTMESVGEVINNSINSETGQNDDNVEEAREILPELVELYNINSDLYGWINIEGTDIDYPIVHTTDNEYYLSHDFYKNDNSLGTLFIDYRNNGINDTNVLIYGHNMRNGEMFSSLTNYKEYSYFTQYNTISIDTLYERLTYKIIAVCTGKVAYQDEEGFRYYDFTQASSIEEMKVFWEHIKLQSIYEVTYEFNENDNYLTLSTCSNFTENGRLYIVAVRED